LKKSSTVGKMRQPWQMRHTCKNVPHLQKCATLEKSAPSLHKFAALGKLSHT